MASSDLPKAAEAKKAGNASYQKGKWVEAIGHYTTASVLDPTDPAPLLNRAQAFLKLDKWKDAERDCSRVLALVGQGRNVKALFRRAVARRELSLVDAARSDLDQLLKIEPGNAAAREELAALDSAAAATAGQPQGGRKARTLPADGPPASASVSQPGKSASPPPGRDRARDTGKRVPITVVHTFSPIPAYVPPGSGEASRAAAPSTTAESSTAAVTPSAQDAPASSFSTLRAARSTTKKQLAGPSTTPASGAHQSTPSSGSVSPPPARSSLSPSIAHSLRDVRMSSAERDHNGADDARMLMSEPAPSPRRARHKPTSGLEWIMRWEATPAGDRAELLLGTDPPSLARALEHIIEPDHLASLHRALADATPSLRDADKPAVREVLRALRGMRGYAICGGLRSAQETGWEEAVERWCA